MTDQEKILALASDFLADLRGLVKDYPAVIAEFEAACVRVRECASRFKAVSNPDEFLSAMAELHAAYEGALEPFRKYSETVGSLATYSKTGELLTACLSKIPAGKDSGAFSQIGVQTLTEIATAFARSNARRDVAKDAWPQIDEAANEFDNRMSDKPKPESDTQEN